MALSSNLLQVLSSLDCYTDQEKELIAEEFNLANVPSDSYILADLNMVAQRLKREGIINSEVPSYEKLCEVAESVNGIIYHSSDGALNNKNDTHSVNNSEWEPKPYHKHHNKRYHKTSLRRNLFYCLKKIGLIKKSKRMR